MKIIKINYLDVRKLESIFTYFLHMRSKEVSADKLKGERELQEKFWMVHNRMKKAVEKGEPIFLVLSDEDPYLYCKRCKHRWIPRAEKLPKFCPKCNSPYWNKEYSRSDKVEWSKYDPLKPGEKEFNTEQIIQENRKICLKNAKKYGHTAEEADNCDETINPICPFCPFICK